jgi:hypothetical protein
MTPTDPILSPEQVCPTPEDCCRELTRVWQALDLRISNGQSASENVAALRARVAALEAEKTQIERNWREAIVLFRKTEEKFVQLEASAYTRGRESVLAKVRVCFGGWLATGHGVDTCWFCDAEATAAWEHGVPIHKCEHRPDCLWAEAEANPPTRGSLPAFGFWMMVMGSNITVLLWNHGVKPARGWRGWLP